MTSPLTFALPPGASEPREPEHWSYDRNTGRIEDSEGRPVLYMSSTRMDAADATGRKGRATRTGHLAAAAPDMLVALKAALRTIASMGGDLEVTAPESINANTYDDELRRLRAVIAKAEGRTS